ncbi:MAG: proline dehydrogenase family protein [Ilumatobacteraceae bacterium]
MGGRPPGRGGARIKVRIVKGANLAMEEVDAELHDWTCATYGSKSDVDASYKALLDAALRPEWANALRIGVASHNLFDVAWAMLAVEARSSEATRSTRVEFEMLRGMAPAQARAVEDCDERAAALRPSFARATSPPPSPT